jgi:large subunit ribosomal protein L9
LAKLQISLTLDFGCDGANKSAISNPKSAIKRGQKMKIILTEKINKLGNIGDTVEVKTGFARNYLLPNGKAMRWSRENVAAFEAKKAELQAKHDAAKKSAESKVDAVKNAKLYMIRQAGDTGHLYGSVSSRDIARMLTDAGVAVESAQVLLGSPIKTIGAFETRVALHADVIVPIKVYVAQTSDEIDALVAGKVLTFGGKKNIEESDSDSKSADETVAAGADVNSPASEPAAEKPARKPRAKKSDAAQELMDDVAAVATASPEDIAIAAEESENCEVEAK